MNVQQKVKTQGTLYLLQRLWCVSLFLVVFFLVKIPVGVSELKHSAHQSQFLIPVKNTLISQA